MTVEINNNLSVEEIKKLQNKFRDRAFRMVIEVFFIFGGPALAGYWLGRFLDQTFETGKTLTLVVLALTFLLSWVIVIIKYRQLDRTMKELDRLMRESRSNEK